MTLKSWYKTAFYVFAATLCCFVKVNHAVAQNADSAFQSLINKSISCDEKDQYDSGRSYSTEALRWAAHCKQQDAVAWCYNNIGCTYLAEGDYIKASEAYYTALNELNKKPQEPGHTAVNIYNNLGTVNLRLHQYDKAISFFNKGEDIAKQGHLDFQLAQSYESKGDYYNTMHQHDSAARYYNLEMEIGEKIGRPDLKATASVDLGKTYVEQGDFDRSIPYFQRAIGLAKDRFDYIVTDAAYSLGDAWFRLKNYPEAEKNLRSVIREATLHNMMDDYVRGYARLVDVYKATGQYKQAVACMDSFNTIRDSLTSLEKTKAIGMMEIKFKTAEKDRLITQSQLLIAQQKNKITIKNIWIASIVTGIFLFAFIVVVFYYRSQNKQRLQAEQIKTLQQENTISILKGIVQGEENERSRLARELHDGIGGMLSAATMRFSALWKNNEMTGGKDAFFHAMDLLDEIGDEIRKTAHNLMPEVLLKQNLADALRNYCNLVAEGQSLIVEFQALGKYEDLDQNFKMNVYRIVQELLKNIIEHANATIAIVQLVRHDRTMTVTVEDNGEGFDAATALHGMGLRNIETRVRSLDGSIVFDAAPGKGTTAYIDFEL